MPKQMFDGWGNPQIMYDSNEVEVFKVEIEKLKAHIIELENQIKQLKTKKDLGGRDHPLGKD